ncbi:MAG: hypothetical protein NZO16_00855 [Deltaproteobacteria bacterium]|nr:hypothetical protein [Deltaproteobacteria bacterium]
MRGLVDLILAILILIAGLILFFISFFGINRQQQEFVQMLQRTRLNNTTGMRDLVNDQQVIGMCMQRNQNEGVDPQDFVDQFRNMLLQQVPQSSPVVILRLLGERLFIAPNGNAVPDWFTVLANQSQSCDCILAFSVLGSEPTSFTCCDNSMASFSAGQNGGEQPECVTNFDCGGVRQYCDNGQCRTCPQGTKPLNSGVMHPGDFDASFFAYLNRNLCFQQVSTETEGDHCVSCELGEDCGCPQGQTSDGSGGCDACASGYSRHESGGNYSCVPCQPSDSCQDPCTWFLEDGSENPSCQRTTQVID